MAWDDGLHGPHKEFASACDGRIRCLAGPGTGKTFALTRRVQRLLEENVSPRAICVVTLTRTAADDLRMSLAQLEVGGAEDVHATTLHSLCFSLLLKNSVLEMTGRIPRLLADFEEDFLLRDLPDSLGGIRRKRALQSAYEAAWAALEGDPLGTLSPGLEQQFQATLIETLTWHHCMLVGELVPLARAYLAQNPYAEDLDRFAHVLVDEYQDLNKADHAVIELLIRKSIEQDTGGLAIIGDDDQSIYITLRNAFPEGIVNFTHDCDIPLIECRRCPKRVVAMAENLISHNPTRGKPPLQCLSSNPEGQIRNVVFQNMDHEADGLSEFIINRLSSGYVEPGDILVLANWRQIAYGIRDRITASGYGAHSYFSEEPFDTIAAKQAFTLSNLLAFPDDRVSLRAWLGLYHNRSNVTAYRRIRQYAFEHGLDAFTVLRYMTSGELTIRYCEPAVSAWEYLQERLEQLQPAKEDMSLLIDTLYPDGVDDLALLRRCAIKIIEETDGELTLQVFMKELRRQISVPEVPLDASFVRLMSLHKSKGLTAKLVIIAGMVEGLIPRLPNENVTAIEAMIHEHEQRRMLFVGLTRTTDELVLSKFVMAHAQDGYRSGGMQMGHWISQGQKATIASRFLGQLGSQLPEPVIGENWAY